ncbi:hypothetical protein J7T55_004050 [Diaporthe amygdali]|uniref:uncharacterized protein n=1 Tax=Phomopsis amygdali TaxID=1214568 RepID=UPI0022FE50DA|nr:uncharacterized protein J7T55_004050 [Diaporthe amygdali]KAJ0115881.1 hypothetical protein J7T55_004050 [Diaporthe amygdali]
MGDEGEEIKSFQSLTLDLPPSCVEFCPRYPSHFLVGTYNLEKNEAEERETVKSEDQDEPEVEVEAKKSQSRSGSIIVFELKDGQAHIKQTISQPSAVFDLHFAPQADRGDICAAVSSTGTISIFRLTIEPSASTEGSAENYIQTLSVLSIPELSKDDLFTYFTWHPEIPGLMAVTTSTGQVILARIHKDHMKLERLRTVLKHEAEAWCVAFSPVSHQKTSSGETLSTVFSGGDDSKLLLDSHSTFPDVKDVTASSSGSDSGAHLSHDPESATALDSDTDETFVSTPNRKGLRHDAGVTAILPLRLNISDGYYVVLTGSYSDHLSVWGIIPPYRADDYRRNKLLQRENLGGGVWRLKVIEELSAYPGDCWTVTLLVSCMHAGARVVRLQGTIDTVDRIEVVKRFTEHKSMNYGSDYTWVDGREFFGEGEGKKIACVSTSFYDRLLCLWSF